MRKRAVVGWILAVLVAGIWGWAVFHYHTGSDWTPQIQSVVGLGALGVLALTLRRGRELRRLEREVADLA